jgi:hypothetical protein
VRAGAIADSLGSLRRPWLHGEHLYWRAAIIGALGEHALAVQLLRQANHEGQAMMSWHAAPPLAALRGFPQFEDLIRPRR